MSLARTPTNASPRILAFAGILLLSILGCAAYPSTRRWLLFIPICSMTYYFIFFTKTSDMVMDYALASWLATNVFVMSEFLLLPSTHPSHRRDEPRLSFVTKLKRGFDLFAAARGQGIEGQQQQAPGSIRPNWKPATSRGQGFAKQLATLAKCAALHIAGDVTMQYNPSFELNGLPFRHQPWWLQPSILGYILTSRAIINASYCVAAIVSIGLGLSEPDEWPPLFGSFVDAFTVHNSWRCVFTMEL